MQWRSARPDEIPNINSFVFGITKMPQLWIEDCVRVGVDLILSENAYNGWHLYNIHSRPDNEIGTDLIF